MSIGTRIAAGYGILMVLMVVLLVYYVSLTHHLQLINLNLSDTNFNAALLSINLLRDLNQIEEDSERFFLAWDPDSDAKLRAKHEAFEKHLKEISSLSLSLKERTEVARLYEMWSEFSTMASPAEQPLMNVTEEEGKTQLAQRIAHLMRLRNQTQSVILVTEQAIKSQVENSTKAGRLAEQVSWIAAVVFTVLSFLIPLLIVQSISQPLKSLTEGTRAIAEGKFSYQFQVSGNDELTQLAKDFNTMTRRLNELDQMKKDFVSHVSHELKAPLASMQETIQLLLEQIPGALTDKQRRLLELNLQSSKRLSSMIAHLLDLSRMEVGVIEYEMKPQDLSTLIRIVLAELDPHAHEKGTNIEVDLPQHPFIVECDGDRIVQVIQNLLENALKFSPRGATIGLSICFVPDIPTRVPESWREKISTTTAGQGFALMTVSDSGPGIPDPHKQRIFEKFHQIKQGKKIAGQGVGLGLAICRTIVEAHHGAIWVEDNPSGGSSFLVLLPMEASGEPVAERVSLPI
jgi:two-component system sensor histidine kinase GlrK